MNFGYHSKPKTKNAREPCVTVIGKIQEGNLLIGVARCSSNDNFCKKYGRQLAEKRLLDGQPHTILPMESCSVKTFLFIAKAIVSEVKETKRVKGN